MAGRALPVRAAARRRPPLFPRPHFIWSSACCRPAPLPPPPPPPSLHLVQRVHKIAVQQDLVGRAEAEADAVEAQRAPRVLVLLAPHGSCTRTAAQAFNRQGTGQLGRLPDSKLRRCCAGQEWRRQRRRGSLPGARACMHVATHPRAANSPVKGDGAARRRAQASAEPAKHRRTAQQQ